MDTPRAGQLGITRSWGAGPEVLFLSNPLVDPVEWSSAVREDLIGLGFRVTTFEHRPSGDTWRDVVACVGSFVKTRERPVALVGWSQGAVIAQEVALAHPGDVTCAALIATYGRQNQVDRVLQDCWDVLASEDIPDCLRLGFGLLTAFSPDALSDDAFVRGLVEHQDAWAGPAQDQARRRSAAFIASYQDRLEALTGVDVPCLVMSFEHDTDAYASRAREVSRAIPRSTLIEVPGTAHAAPVTDPAKVWPEVCRFLHEHHGGG